MYNPMAGRWMEEDPIEFKAGDANLYRDVGNDPANHTDPSGLFEYSIREAPVFSGSKVGYSLGLNISYTGRPPRGSFIQVNRIETTVITLDSNGKPEATTTVTYKVDRKKLNCQEIAYPDTLAGPGFKKELAKDAILVFSHVTKEQGYTRKNVKNLRGIRVNDKVADQFRQSMDNTLSKGKIDYSFTWVNAGRMNARNKLKKTEKEILGTVDEKYRKTLESFLVKNKIALSTYNGQKLEGEAGINAEANLDGTKKD